MRCYTTGEVARICRVTKRTVIKWIDGRRLRGYRIPGSRHRRVAAPDLADFMRRYGLPDGESVAPPPPSAAQPKAVARLRGAGPPPPSAAQPKTVARLRGAGPRRRILIVDDDADFVSLLRDALRDRYTVDAAGCALEAAGRIPVFEPDLILVDLRLPDLSGMDVCRHVRGFRKERRAAILAMSAYGREIDRRQILSSGADDFIAKPVKLAELRRRIRTMVG